MIRAMVALLLAAFVLSGCNTVEGAGRDIQSIGKTVADAAD